MATTTMPPPPPPRAQLSQAMLRPRALNYPPNCRHAATDKGLHLPSQAPCTKTRNVDAKLTGLSFPGSGVTHPSPITTRSPRQPGIMHLQPPP
ncbi:hypothetical protein ZHAS_00003952 [Anopheles sinensis]|uniref:Uncharacterized protein n=1 Tax=Anopheles sinensis TaxID=74873 RepID=A0A084VFP7_ANOSI|nr:hypothetical protein ZHAS_00003952 [Anopheles sinensis]